MLRSAASKVMWVGRATVFLVGLSVILALVFGVATTALGANRGGFILGRATNTATKVTGLIGKVATGSALVVKNPSGGSALDLRVGDPTADPATKTVAPMKVDSQQVVTNLNADELDGKSASDFYAAGSKVDDSSHADVADAAATAKEADHANTADLATKADSARDADTLNGQDSTAFLGAGQKAADADRLDGLDSSSYLPGGDLPSGQTIRGVYDATFRADVNRDENADAISFAFTLASGPQGHFIRQNATPPAACPGSASDPQAAPGHLCIYEVSHQNVDGDDTGIAFGGTSRYGSIIEITSAISGISSTYGTWAVTAP